jgi:long-chain acyl-CoA synthetase
MKSGLAALAHEALVVADMFCSARCASLGYRLRSTRPAAPHSVGHFQVFQAMGVPLRTLYGQTELLGAYTLHPFGRSTPTPRAWRWRRHRDHIDNPDIPASARSWSTPTYSRLLQGPRPPPPTWRMAGCIPATPFNPNKQLVVIDRIKDLAETSRGSVLAAILEDKLKFRPISPDGGAGRRAALAAMICIHFDHLEMGREEAEFVHHLHRLASRPGPRLCARKSKATQRCHPRSASPTFLLLRNSMPTTASGPHPKSARSVINEKYAGIIDAIYGGKSDIPLIP